MLRSRAGQQLAGEEIQDARPANPTAATEFGTTHRNRPGTNRFHSHRVASQMQASGTDIRHFYTAPGTPPPGVRVVVNPGGTNAEFDKDHLHAAQVVSYPDNNTIFEQLTDNAADV